MNEKNSTVTVKQKMVLVDGGILWIFSNGVAISERLVDGAVQCWKHPKNRAVATEAFFALRAAWNAAAGEPTPPAVLVRYGKGGTSEVARSGA